VNGLFVEEQDPAQLGEKILQLAGDPAMRARMGRANREKFEGAYTHRHFGRRIIAVFDALLVSRGD
jgi:glycosyltransferase involved in cell wall biosynthesis